MHIGAALFRQPRFAQALDIVGTMLRPAMRRKTVPEIGDSKRRIELTQPRHVLLRLREIAGQRVTGRRYSTRICVVLLLPQSLFGPSDGGVIPTGLHVSLCSVRLAYENTRLEWAQPHGT